MSADRPRASVRSHLRHLMAATAVLGLAAATTRTAGSAPSTTKTDAGVGGDAGKDAARDAVGDGAVAAVFMDASIDGEVDAEGPIPVEPCPEDGRRDSTGRCLPGYGVVDPLPPPSRGGCGCHKEPGMASGPDQELVE